MPLPGPLNIIFYYAVYCTRRELFHCRSPLRVGRSRETLNAPFVFPYRLICPLLIEKMGCDAQVLSPVICHFITTPNNINRFRGGRTGIRDKSTKGRPFGTGGRTACTHHLRLKNRFVLCRRDDILMLSRKHQ